MSTKTPAATELTKLIPTNLAKMQERLRKVTTEYTALLQKAAPPRGVVKAVPTTR